MQQHASALADPQEAADEMHPLSLSPGAMPEESYSVPRTGALLTLAEAKSRLFHYCAKLPSDRYHPSCVSLLSPCRLHRTASWLARPLSGLHPEA